MERPTDARGRWRMAINSVLGQREATGVMWQKAIRTGRLQNRMEMEGALRVGRGQEPPELGHPAPPPPAGSAGRRLVSVERAFV